MIFPNDKQTQNCEKQAPFVLYCLLMILLSLHFTVCSAQSRHRRSLRHAHRTLKPLKPTMPEKIDPELREAMRQAPRAERFPNSPAAHLLDLTDVDTTLEWIRIEQTRYAYKLYTDQARHLAEVTLKYDPRFEHILVKQARTIGANGVITEVRKKDIREKLNRAAGTLSGSQTTVSFSLPNISPGCVIDYSYVKTIEPIVLPHDFTQAWVFDGPFPVGLSRFTLHFPAKSVIRSQSFHCDDLQPQITLENRGTTKRYVWEVRGSAPIETEPMMPPRRALAKLLVLSTLPNWGAIADWVREKNRSSMKPDRAIRAAVVALTAGRKSEEARAAAIYDWVASRIKTLSAPLSTYGFVGDEVKDTYRNRYGDSMDKVLLLIAMLDLAGIKARPALLKSGSLDPLKSDLPDLDFLDRCVVLARVDGQRVWLDPSAEGCVYGDLPTADRGAQALIVRDRDAAFLTIPACTPELNAMRSKIEITLRADGSGQMRIDLKMQGDLSQMWRAGPGRASADLQKQAIAAMAQGIMAGATVDRYELPLADSPVDPYAMTLWITAPHYARVSGNLLMTPLSFNDTEDTLPDNPLRKWPIVQTISLGTFQ